MKSSQLGSPRATWAAARLLCLQAVGEATSPAAGHRTASLHGFVRRITFNKRPWRHWHPQQNKYMHFPIYITSPQIPVANLWMRI